MMRAFLATVLSVIAVGVLLIAYGLLNPRVTTAQGGVVTIDPRDGSYQLARPVAYTRDRMAGPDDPYGRAPMPYAVNESRDVRDPRDLYAPRPYYTSPAPVAARRVATVERGPRRDWKKTALVIGGSTAAGAGIGGIFGGGKGAAIGAAIGGGASTLFEALHK
jgi:hypothetical protein